MNVDRLKCCLKATSPISLSAETCGTATKAHTGHGHVPVAACTPCHTRSPAVTRAQRRRGLCLGSVAMGASSASAAEGDEQWQHCTHGTGCVQPLLAPHFCQRSPVAQHFPPCCTPGTFPSLGPVTSLWWPGCCHWSHRGLCQGRLQPGTHRPQRQPQEQGRQQSCAGMRAPARVKPGIGRSSPQRTSHPQTTAPSACPRLLGAWLWLCRRRRSPATRRNP